MDETQLMKYGPPPLDTPRCRFPPDLSWNTVRDILHEVMGGLHRGWIQDHLLNQLPQLGSSLLCSTAKLSEGLPVTFKVQAASMLEFHLPGFTKNGITAGIGVLRDRDGLLSELGHPGKFMFSHYVENNLTAR